MKKGKLIVIDGVDGSGKTTQAKILINKLKKHKISTQYFEFPEYQSLFGKLIARYLNLEFGRLDPHIASVLYAANRFEARDRILKAVNSGKIVILNRYVSSNQIHQASHISSSVDRKKFVDWIDKVEYGIFSIPRPDIVLFLSIPPGVSYQLVEKKSPRTRKYIQGAKRDWLESDFEFQDRSEKQSEKLYKENYNWRKIQCVKDGQLLSKAAIGELIWNEVSKLVKSK
jgi:dTMP kinase